MSTPTDSVAPPYPTGTSSPWPMPAWWKRISDWIAALSPSGADKYDTGWQPITLLSGYTAEENLGVRRVGKEVFIRGAVKSTAGVFPTTLTAVGSIPAGYRPGYYFRAPGTSYPSPTARGSEWAVAENGGIAIGSIGAGTDICRLNASWLID